MVSSYAGQYQAVTMKPNTTHSDFNHLRIYVTSMASTVDQHTLHAVHLMILIWCICLHLPHHLSTHMYP